MSLGSDKFHVMTGMLVISQGSRYPLTLRVRFTLRGKIYTAGNTSRSEMSIYIYIYIYITVYRALLQLSESGDFTYNSYNKRTKTVSTTSCDSLDYSQATYNLYAMSVSNISSLSTFAL